MKIKLPTHWPLLTVALFLANSITYSQVGINTTTPNGILEINSSTNGVVLPRLALTRTNIMAPATNPQTGVIPVGTTVYNTNTTTSGANDVSPGMYAWDGTKWVPQFNRKQSVFYEQSNSIRTLSNEGQRNIPGLVSQSFLPKYTGKYRLSLSVNYGGGNAKVPNQGTGSGKSDGNLNIALESGIFYFTFNGTTYQIPAHAYSTAYDSSVSATNYFAIWRQYTFETYINLTANQAAAFNLTFDQDTAFEFIGSGNSGDGRGHVFYDIPCTVEVTYVGD